MPRENSFSDSDGRSLTPDLEDDHFAPPISPTYSTRPQEVYPPRAPVTSQHSIKSHSATNAGHGRQQSPRDKFRAGVRKVIAMHRGTKVITQRGVGSEPGVDPRRNSADIQYGNIRQDCVIEVFDYSSVRSSFGRMTNREFVNLMNDSGASTREPWVKVRWINIGGMSWDVIKAVSIKYELHPLALEDVFHTRSQTRSKVDYYTKHLFLRILCHELSQQNELLEDHQSPAYGSTLTDIPRSASPFTFDGKDTLELEAGGKGEGDEATVYGSMPSRGSTMKARRRKQKLDDPERRGSSPLSFFSRIAGDTDEQRNQRRQEELKLQVLKGGERVNVKVSPMFIFLLRDGTVISLHSTPNLDFTQPITQRLHQRDTGLRATADPSLLVQSLLDLIVDKALEVIDEYHVKIKQYESEILLKPEMSTVRNLHILSGDLILHKRTLAPIKTVVYGLRRYDLDRCAALVDSTEAARANAKPVVGYMTHKAKIYLADVHDHMEYILTSLDMFAGIGENLIDYTFNMASYEMNEVMRRLTLATIIFLPLTLLTGYFGMNFTTMPSITGSDLFFWEIAIPMLLVVAPLFLGPDIRRLWHYMEKKMATKKVVKYHKQA